MSQYAGSKEAAARQPVTDVSGDCCRRYTTLQEGRLDEGGSLGVIAPITVTPIHM